MTLVAYLEQTYNGKYSDSNGTWRQFVIDHKVLIRKNGVKRIISADKMSQMRYNLTRLAMELNFTASAIWIIYLINDFLVSDLQMHNKNVSDVLIVFPDMTYLEELHTSYKSMQSNAQAD